MEEETENIPYAVLEKMLSQPIEDFESWFLLNPENGDMWIVPVKDIPDFAYKSGCIVPHKDGWYPVFDSLKGVYEGCTSDSGVYVSIPQIMKKGVKVVKGPSWDWGSQGDSGDGTVVEVGNFGDWPMVRWVDDSTNRYRWIYATSKSSKPGFGVYDLKVTTVLPSNTKMLAKYKRVCII